MKAKILKVAAGLAITAMFSAAPATASIFTYTASLSGLAESPPNASPGTGFAIVIVDDSADTLQLSVTFSGLSGTTTASHIHCCTADAGIGNIGVATTLPTFAGFPLGVTSGTYDVVLDLLSTASYNASFISDHGDLAGAEAALLAGLASGSAYINIHTNLFPAGEIRGFLETPLPASLPLFATGAGALGLLGWRKKRTKAVARAA
jgi:CHRD domain